MNLSARQFTMLTQLVDQRKLSIEDARALNQSTFGSLLHRQYIQFNKKTEEFQVTTNGVHMFYEFRNQKIHRENVTGAFSHYFTGDIIALTKPKVKVRRKIHTNIGPRKTKQGKL